MIFRNETIKVVLLEKSNYYTVIIKEKLKYNIN
jgi:hypothetical protein